MVESAEQDPGMRCLRCTIELAADVGRVYRQWTRFEELPRLMDGVRHARQIDERRVLWDVDVFGHQIVWEAEIVESVPNRRIRWATRAGVRQAGEVAFEALPGDRTRLTVEICHRPQGVLERLGARLGLPELRIRRDLAHFRRALERSQPRRMVWDG